MIIMAPIFPKRPPIGVLFDFLSWGWKASMYFEPTIRGPEVSDNPGHQMIQSRELISGVLSIRQEGKTNWTSG